MQISSTSKSSEKKEAQTAPSNTGETRTAPVSQKSTSISIRLSIRQMSPSSSTRPDETFYRVFDSQPRHTSDSAASSTNLHKAIRQKSRSADEPPNRSHTKI